MHHNRLKIGGRRVIQSNRSVEKRQQVEIEKTLKKREIDSVCVCVYVLVREIEKKSVEQKRISISILTSEASQRNEIVSHSLSLSSSVSAFRPSLSFPYTYLDCQTRPYNFSPTSYQNLSIKT